MVLVPVDNEDREERPKTTEYSIVVENYKILVIWGNSIRCIYYGEVNSVRCLCYEDSPICHPVPQLKRETLSLTPSP